MADDSLRDIYCSCHHLRRAARRLTRFYESVLEPGGLTAMQFAILATIARNPQAGRAGIARLLDMDASTLSRGLAPLMRDGLVAPEGGRRRSAPLALTSDGEAVFTRAVPAWQRAQNAVHAALGGEGTRTLHALLADLPGDGDAPAARS